jgi:hypothetical protein
MDGILSLTMNLFAFVRMYYEMVVDQIMKDAYLDM